MSKRLVFISCLCFCIFFSNVGILAPKKNKSLQKIISDLQKTYDSLEDFQAEFAQVEINSLLQKRKKSSGIIYSLSKGRVFWHTKKPQPLKVISNGKVIWLYYPNEKQVFTQKWNVLDNQTKLALLLFRGKTKLENHFHVSWSNVSGKDKVIRLIPKKQMNVQKIELSLSKNIVFLKKIIFYFPLDRKTELTLINLKFNQKLLNHHKKKPLDKDISPSFQFILPSKTNPIKK